MARDYLLQEIKKGSYSKGQKIPTESMLTRDLGVSRNTIREAVSSLVHDGVLERRQGSGTYVLIDRPVAQGKRLSPQRVVRIGLVVHGEYRVSQSPYLLGLSRGISTETTDSGPVDLRFLVSDTAYRHVGGIHFLDAVEADTVDALVFSVVEVNLPDLNPVIESGIPVVFMGSEYPHRKFPCVRPDLSAGVTQLARFLYDTGRDALGLLLPRRQGRTAASFLAGLVAANSQQGRESDLSRVVYTEEDPHQVPAAVETLVERGTQAILCYDDETAIAAIQYLNTRGLRVPQDIAVTGTNDTAPVEGADYPPLTTLRLPLEDIGRAARDLIFDGMRTGAIPPRTMIFEPELVIRRSAPNRGPG